jgi:hypothetical protein
VPMRRFFPDHTTAENSAKLARKIERFWHDQGYTQVHAWTEKVKLLHGEIRDSVSAIYCVRSNLIRGLPPGSVAPSMVAENCAA